ncbi:MAG: NAD(P)H-dependent oxidoreductase subunit E [Desulfovibrio sp.]|nr:NAD(P)H-dependent oxidoreductase subunit E [Desulfovibrio sp.]
MDAEFEHSVIDAILDENGRRASSVISILQNVQEHYRYLPRWVFPYLSRAIAVSEARIYSVATFYENFSLEPKGRHIIKICDGTACHLRRSIPILERLRSDLGLSETKATTDALEFTVETVSCLGACGLGPVITVNDKVYPAMSPDRAARLVMSLREEMSHAAS